MNEDEVSLWGTLTAFQYMLEYLCAELLIDRGATKSDVYIEREAMLRNFEELPWRNDSQGDEVLRLHALGRLESMWKAIDGKVALAASSDGGASL